MEHETGTWNTSDFVREWCNHVGRHGMSRPLPRLWRVRVEALRRLGLDADAMATAVAAAQHRFDGKTTYSTNVRSAAEIRFNYFMTRAYAALNAEWGMDDADLPRMLVDRGVAVKAKISHDAGWAGMGPLVRKDTDSEKNAVHDIACPGLVGADPSKYTTVAEIGTAPTCAACKPEMLPVGR